MHTDAFMAPPPIDSSIYDKQLAWKLHGQRKLASRSQELRAQQEQECTFSPKTTSRSLRAADYADEDDGGSGEHSMVATSVETEAALLHPTESQETSIQMYLARQERAREQAHEAQQKLAGVSLTKDFGKVTAVEPFALSTTNWKPRQSTIESPTRVCPVECPAVDDERQAKVTSKTGAKTKMKGPAQTARGSNKSPRCSHATCGAAAVTTKEEEAWESERATLVSIIDAQRRELALREQAQQEAVRVAERFATATQAFEERLVTVEQSAVKELEEVKRLLASQAAATDLILTSLGITRRPGSTSGSSRYD
ncbi:hypothetical protein PF007_g27490 [Phytophthora fragariae]|nr:hypothetical protein PF009_g28173 [Phytophthora fragariae]KAE9068978.1 hypothetical protein PF007_g27490 [Phytophthora fragariae]KAE9142565.1 hypothetical protein PF006_g12332 [Phytophthora fragariae]KAE9276000.1 hypothetical protein PF001_g26337 [Phytophthora fragariae]